MKLRNKKTGEIVSFRGIAIHKESFDLYDENDKKLISDIQTLPTYYECIAGLNAEWEDYTPKEPLIKDENIRKLIMSWAYINDIKSVNYYIFQYPRSYRFTYYGDEDDLSIDFTGWIPNLIEEGTYTIAELCGEEEQ